jgi:hypothetical protein
MLVLHVVVANFIASNVAVRLPSGHLSFVHLNLHKSSVWRKLGGQDFIETDDHEQAADHTIGVKKIFSMKSSALKDFLMTDSQRLRGAFQSWVDLIGNPLGEVEVVIESWDRPVMIKLQLHKIWGAWRSEVFRSLRNGRSTSTPSDSSSMVVDSRNPWRRESKQVPLTQGDHGLRPSFCENVYQDDIALQMGRHRDKKPSLDVFVGKKSGAQVTEREPALRVSQRSRGQLTQGDQGLRPSFCENVYEDVLEVPSRKSSKEKMDLDGLDGFISGTDLEGALQKRERVTDKVKT